MIDPAEFIGFCRDGGIQRFIGVPDSLLAPLSQQISSECSADDHIISANEGSAIGLAIGFYVSEGKPCLIYMQNSGLGNAVNPIVSLADDQVYGVPMLLVIGWRGEILDSGDQLSDEPQHRKQGQITLSLLETLGIDYAVINKNTLNCEDVVKSMIGLACEKNKPTAIVIRKGVFNQSKKGLGSQFTEGLM